MPVTNLLLLSEENFTSYICMSGFSGVLSQRFWHLPCTPFTAVTDCWVLTPRTNYWRVSFQSKSSRFSAEPKHFPSHLSNCFLMILKIKWHYDIFSHDLMTCMEGWPHYPQTSIFITLQSSALSFIRWLMETVFMCHLVLFSECSHTPTSMINISNAIISTAVLIKR